VELPYGRWLESEMLSPLSKAGRLEKLLQHAEVVSIFLSEKWPKGRVERLLADLSYEDAVNVMKERRLWRRVPVSVKSYFGEG